jgi:hypothetical protein
VDSAWRSSSRCDGGACVEAARIEDDVRVRDSDRRELDLTAQAWTEFVAGVKDGEFDRPR